MRSIILACAVALAACGTNTVTYVYVDGSSDTADTVDGASADTVATDALDDASADAVKPLDSANETDAATDDEVAADTVEPDVEPTGTCMEYFDCAYGCPPVDEACGKACAAKRSPTAVGQVSAFTQCQAVKGCNLAETDAQYYACIDEFCYEPYFACFSTPGGLDCAGISVCFGECPGDNPGTQGVDEATECKAACYLAASYQGNMDLVAYRQCVSGKCPICKVANPTPSQDAECNDCIDGAVAGACKDAHDKCTPAGTNGCNAMQACLPSCGNDTTCIKACFAGGTLKAQDLWNAYTACVSEECPGWEDACMNNATTGACKSAYDACLAD